MILMTVLTGYHNEFLVGLMTVKQLHNVRMSQSLEDLDLLAKAIQVLASLIGFCNELHGHHSAGRFLQCLEHLESNLGAPLSTLI